MPASVHRAAKFYKWKTKYEGMGLSEIRRMRLLEDENARLKKIVALPQALKRRLDAMNVLRFEHFVLSVSHLLRAPGVFIVSINRFVF